MVWCYAVIFFIALMIASFYREPVQTGDGAIAMAFGILISGAVRQIHPLLHYAGPYLAILLFTMVVRLCVGYGGKYCKEHSMNVILQTQFPVLPSAYGSPKYL
ncbi:hypothetical protein [Effusibacillus dendaii]|uniref:Uncharacterized protein n=1 Tax=Effusibacillus dendaii TaxID=2743772 RepID=A0A7I8DFB6_9BACL|nr:hypothetical protein [Effusibacillus dendaii]BCJ87250.1 hypothetical protein skT53_22350 [Effusibacillus dendaii]